MSSEKFTQAGLREPALRKVVAGSFAGALLEWYDFFAFGTASGLVFGRLFFPDADPMVATIAAFAFFGVGFWARPLGGIVFGHFGDRVGRKVTLIWTIMIVGITTFLIGCLPTYAQVGIWAPILLVALRLLQGFGLGGEYGGASLMAIESAPRNRRGFIGSLPQAASSAGVILATSVFAACDLLLTDAQFMSWGWRIPFWLSAPMLVVGLYIRIHVAETKDFASAQGSGMAAGPQDGAEPRRTAEPRTGHPVTGSASRQRAAEGLPVVELFRRHPRNIILATGARLVETVFFNAIYSFAVAYMVSTLGMDRHVPLTGMLLAASVGIVMCPIAGWLSDRYGQRSIYLLASLVCTVISFGLFEVLGTRDVVLIYCAMIVGFSLGPVTLFAVQPTMFSRMFDTNVRYTGLSVAYQVSAIVGGMTPLFAASLLALGDGNPRYVVAYLAGVSAISCVCVWLIRYEAKQDPFLPFSCLARTRGRSAT
ncbi:MFS transporter [Azospirillum thermophilum]|uniref:MFS transporter n=1 Tax=Azospirillum thermophilum TaxID=2202148 RepID=A0A2S2CKB3_9PROT|nr:MFS transporter [Azospirillum thermophilum]AWK84934.1 MFS transporter [Azospirillum thermophilum]